MRERISFADSVREHGRQTSKNISDDQRQSVKDYINWYVLKFKSVSEWLLLSQNINSLDASEFRWVLHEINNIKNSI